MMEIFDFLLSKVSVFVNFMNSLIIVNFRGVNVTLLGFIGSLIVISVLIRLFMPKTH